MIAFPRLAGSLALVAGLMVSSTASAFGPATAPATAATHKGIATQLHQAHELLEKADHDYDGHRAKAAHEVREAMKELMGTHHKGTGTTTGQKATTAKAAGTQVAGQKAGANGGKGTMKMPQEESDKYLQQASKILSQAMTQMPSGHKAAGKVQEAIKEIGVALAKK